MHEHVIAREVQDGLAGEGTKRPGSKGGNGSSRV